MPRVIGGSLDAHREHTRGLLFDSFGRLLYQRGYDDLTLAEVAREAGLARTAIYNYFPDKESLLVAYATAETAGFVDRLDEVLRTVDNPVDQLRTYVRLHLEYFSANHLPPGPTLRVLLPEAAAERLMEHVGILESRLYDIVRRGRERRYLRAEDIDATVAMIAACIGRAGSDATSAGSIREAVDAAEAFVLRAVDARVSADGTPRRIPRR
ncbi:MAG: TetR/AcrR family transcriptional regulator [Microthrixaceae bacterium]|nr:TetR/AcrR family transcriptional regulator [Acidimicrobiales bacterium]MCB9404610.1 TetR/AcrR family transcriptional regulator [Microthrixaceae bacterium]